MKTLRRRRGQTIAAAIRLPGGEPTTIATVTAVLRKTARRDGAPVTPPDPVNMAVDPYPASSGEPAGWRIALSGAQTSSLPLGSYEVLATVTFSSGEVEKPAYPVFVAP